MAENAPGKITTPAEEYPVGICQHTNKTRGAGAGRQVGREQQKTKARHELVEYLSEP
jgi:hypothetical protein